jgi:hypothetical protein
MATVNDVYSECPMCGEECWAQIPQVIHGLGDLYLKNPEFVKEMNLGDLNALKKLIENERFYCREHGCFRVSMHFWGV